MKTYVPSFPKKSLGWMLLGVLLLTVFFLLHGFEGKTFVEAKVDPRAIVLYYGSPLLAIAGLWAGRHVFPFILGNKKTIIINDDTFSVGREAFSYQAVRGFLYDFGNKDLKIVLSDKKISIREEMYRDFDEIKRELFERTRQRLVDEVYALLRNGAVKFGKHVALSKTSLTVKDKVIGLQEIKKARLFRGNNNGAEYEEMIVEAVSGKKIDIETNGIENCHILIEYIEANSPNLKAGL